MDIMEKLVELLGDKLIFGRGILCEIASHLIDNDVTIQKCARPLEEWCEDYGDVFWWKFPIEEPPYVGSPLDEKWPAYHTHWTPIEIPKPPKGE